MKRIIALLIFVFSIFALQAQQVPQYSHNMFNQMAINPGYAGSRSDIDITLINRQQWVGFEGAPQTTVFTASTAIKPFGISSGVSLSVMDDRYGFNKNFMVKAGYAYRTQLANGDLGIGFDVGIFNSSFEASKLVPAENEDKIPSADGSDMAFDASFGAFFQTEKFYIGLSASNILSPKIDIDKASIQLERHYFLAAGYNLKLPIPLLELNPSIFIKSDGSTFAVDLNANVLYNKKFWGGVTYRTGDALIVMLGMELSNGIRLGYAYDLVISDLASYQSGAHELMIGYSFNVKIEKLPRKYKSIRFL